MCGSSCFKPEKKTMRQGRIQPPPPTHYYYAFNSPCPHLRLPWKQTHHSHGPRALVYEYRYSNTSCTCTPSLSMWGINPPRVPPLSPIYVFSFCTESHCHHGFSGVFRVSERGVRNGAEFLGGNWIWCNQGEGGGQERSFDCYVVREY